MAIEEYAVEICATSAENALIAQRGGAGRVELCAAMPEGGTTPSLGEIETTRRLIDIKLHVLIRPRSGDFLYTEIERNVILRDIELAKQSGADGVVVGCLTPDGDVDVPMMRQFVSAADGMSVTFHRAFDMCRNPQQALEDIIMLGCDRLLTSGQAATAEQGVQLIRELVEQAAGRITIMPGCGVNSSNAALIATLTGCTELHLSARRRMSSPMRFRRDGVAMGGVVNVEEYATSQTDPNEVRAVKEALCRSKL